jgi:hypothetical protein
MLYLRNTNQQQSLGRDIKRGITNVCCTPTLESVVSASLTELTVTALFGTYLINCKSCVGGYIHVSENSGSSWTTINPGNCSVTNLVPMPSQSAYYRLFTSCSSDEQPFDPLTSDYSNEILYIPNSRLNYNFVENLANARFTIAVTGSTILDTTTAQSGTFYQIPSSSAVSASIQSLSVPYTGSTSMSLLITGSNVSYYTSSCVFNSSSIFVGDYIAIPNQDYYVTASIDHLPGRQSICGPNELQYTVDSYDAANEIWYPANQQGTFTSASTSYGFITGSAVRTNQETGDCRYNAIYMSGSATFDLPTPGVTVPPAIYLAIASGSFTVYGGTSPSAWSLSVSVEPGGGDVVLGGDIVPYTISNTTTKNSIIGFTIGTYVSPFGRREVGIYVNGQLVSINPPTTDPGFTYSLGEEFILVGEGLIRSFGYGIASQTYYNCLYETTPST